MNENLELLTEAISNEIGELKELLNEDNISVEFKNKLSDSIDNIETINDRIYTFYENLPEEDDTSEENELLKEILSDKLSNSDKIHIRVSYGIDLK